MSLGETPPAVRRRTRERRPQLVRTATRLFWEQGYHGTTMADIAAACGVTAGALYRHVPDKHFLLIEAIREMVYGSYAGAQVAVDGADDPRDAVRRLARSVATSAVDHPIVVGLWHREGRYLDGRAHDELLGLRVRLVNLWAEPLRACLPGLSADEANLRTRAAFGLLNAVPIQPAGLSREWLIDTTSAVVEAMVLADETHLPSKDPAGHQASPRPASGTRTDALLREGARLFRRHGYQGVGVDEIAAAAGIRGPTMYEHFSSKAELLGQILRDIGKDFDRALAAPLPADPTPAIVIYLSRYVQAAFDRRDEVAIYASERQHLDPDTRRLIEANRLTRAKALGDAYRRSRPDLSERTAQVVMLCATEAVFAVARSQRFRPDRGHTRLVLSLVAAAVLDPTFT
jgi:AcrR family transcriptional regulator